MSFDKHNCSFILKVILLLFLKLTSTTKAIRKGNDTQRCQIVVRQLSTLPVVLIKSQTVSKSARADTKDFQYWHRSGTAKPFGMLLFRMWAKSFHIKQTLV